ncbi:hypothetical protein F4677DRAFT_20276 [Hypoxylon crocopeplum]|nr:hypothetical protein F4677DRAFT_20276 [Hypoxylon crocopeplum]
MSSSTVNCQVELPAYKTSLFVICCLLLGGLPRLLCREHFDLVAIFIHAMSTSSHTYSLCCGSIALCRNRGHTMISEGPTSFGTDISSSKRHHIRGHPESRDECTP